MNLKTPLVISLLLIGASGILWFLIVLLSSGGYVHGDHLSFAAIARNLAINDKIAHTSAIPATIVHLGHYPEYDVVQPHGFPIIESFFFRIFGVKDWVIGFTSAFFFMLLVPLTYLFGKKLYGEGVGIGAAVLLLGSGAFFPYINSGLTETFYSLLLLSIGYLLIFGESSKYYLLTGLCVGYAYLTRPSTLFYIPLFLVYPLIYEKYKYKSLIGVVLGMLFVILPHSLRNALLSADNQSLNSYLVNLAFFHDREAFYHGFRSLIFPESWVHPLDYILENLSFFIKHYLKNLATFFQGLGSREFAFIGILPFFGFLLTLPETEVQKKFYFIVASLLTLSLLGFSMSWALMRYFLPTLPFILIGVSYFIVHIFKNSERPLRAKVIVGVLTLFLFLPGTIWLSRAFFNRHQQAKYSFIQEMVQKHTSEKSILVSNLSIVVGWYGNRRTVFYPNTLKDLVELDEQYLPIDGFLLTSDLRHSFKNNADVNPWEQILNGKPSIVEGRYRLKAKYDAENMEAVLYVKEE